MSSLMTTLLVWCSCHFIGDFAFQSSWMSNKKGQSWEINLYHCLTYTAPFVLFAHVSFLAAVLLCGIHYVLDTLKARYKVIGPLWLDQILHLATIVFLLILGI